MSVTYRNSLKATRMTAVVTDVGATGKLVIMTSGAAVLATLNLKNPFGSVSNGQLTIDVTGGVSAAASGTGTAALAKITDSTNDIITGLTVGTSAADIIIDNTSINSGQTVTLNSGTINHG